MRIPSRKRVFALACFITLSILASCCACAPHLIEHGCPLCHEECSLCQLFVAGNRSFFLALAVLCGAAILFSCLHISCKTVQRSIFPATLVARFVQLND